MHTYTHCTNNVVSLKQFKSIHNLSVTAIHVIWIDYATDTPYRL